MNPPANHKHRRWLALVSLLTVWSLSAQSLLPNATPGEVSSLNHPDLLSPIRVFVPENYDTSRRWPTLVYYHGTSGEPDTSLLQIYTARRDFVIVGMGYKNRGLLSGTLSEYENIAKDEHAILRAILPQLHQSLALDPKRLYLVGVSKGGWMVSMIGERMGDRIAGMAILLAGRAMRNRPKWKADALGGKPIYLGVGETDGNNIPARRATVFYRRLGAHVTFEEFPGIGHQVTRDAPVFVSWLATNGRLHHRDDAAKAELKAWLKESLQQIKATNTDVERYERIQECYRDPRLRLCGRKTRARVKAMRKKARDAADVEALWQAERTFYQLVADELDVVTFEDIKMVRSGYKKLAKRYPESKWGKRAVSELKRVSERIAMAEQIIDEQKAASPKRKPIGMSTGSSPRGFHGGMR